MFFEYKLLPDIFSAYIEAKKKNKKLQNMIVNRCFKYMESGNVLSEIIK